MQLNITPEQKRAALENAESSLSIEIFNILVKMGIDPDEFVEADVSTMTAPGYEGELLRLNTLISSLSSVREILTSLG